jgi:hypothetical protein
MKPKILFTISIFVLLAATLACQATAPIVAIFATDTPTPTSTPTFTPTPTNTSTPSPTPTNTPTPTPIPEAVVESLSDGSTRFVDHKAGYQFTLPKEWLVVNLAVDDPQQALDDAKKANPDKASILEGLNMVIGQKGRMAAIDFSPGHFKSTTAPILFTILDNKSSSMPLEEVLKSNGEVLPQIMKAKVTVSKIKENPLGVEYGVIDVVITVTANQTTASVHEKLIMFKTEDYTVMITFAVAGDLMANALPDLDEIIASIEVSKP